MAKYLASGLNFRSAFQYQYPVPPFFSWIWLKAQTFSLSYLHQHTHHFLIVFFLQLV